MNLALARTPGQFDGYIFDCDGTLALSMEAHHQAWNEALKKNGAPFDFPWDLFRSMGGIGLKETVHILNTRFSTQLDPKKVVSDQIALVEAFLETIQPNKPITDLAFLLAATYPISVASGNTRKHVHKTLQVIGVHHLFSVIVTQDDVLKSKPSPDLFLLAAKKMKVPPHRCLVLEDSPIGIEAANNAGMQSILIESH